MMACRFINLRVQKLVKDGLVLRLPAGSIIKKMQDVSGGLQKVQAVADWLGPSSSLQASVNVGNMLFNALYQQQNQYGATQPLRREIILSVYRYVHMNRFTRVSRSL